MNPLLQLREATLGYSSHPIFQELNFSVNAGEFLLIGGPNGGGKTTLLKSIAGILPPISGEYRRWPQPNATPFGYVPQQGHVSHGLTVTGHEIVQLGAAAALPWWRAIFSKQTDLTNTALFSCRADEFANTPFSELSGGQRQRVLLARALVLSPSCLLLDEPTAGVDYTSQLIIAELLASLNREKNLTILLVTHEPAPFLPSVSRALWVRNGACEEITPREFSLRREA